MNRREFLSGLACQLMPPMETHLVLAIDVSASVDGYEFKLQREGYAEALQHRDVVESFIQSGGVWLTAFEWSEMRQQNLVFPWTFVATARDAEVVAQAMFSIPRVYSGGFTAVGAAMEYAEGLLRGRHGRKVIDVSGDGGSNQGVQPSDVRNRLQNQGVTVNGLAIQDTEPGVAEYYREHVKTEDGFVMEVLERETMAYTLINKMRREVA